MTFSDTADPLEDLSELTEEDNFSPSYGNQAESLVKESTRLNDIWRDYMSITSKVPVTKDNLEEMILSVVNYQAHDPVQSLN